MFVLIAAFDSNVVDIAFYRFSEMIAEDRTHCPLIGCSGVLQSEGHYGVAVYPQGCSERSMLLVVGIYLNLVYPEKPSMKDILSNPHLLSIMTSVMGSGNSSL